MKKPLLMVLTLSILFFAICLNAQNFISVGDGETQTNQPIYASWNYGWSKTIYKAEYLGGEKVITSIALNQSNQSTMVLQNQKIYFKHTSLENLTGNTAYESPASGDWTQVYDGSFSSTNGWVIVDINDFSYNGQDNLMILWENHHGAETYTGPQFYSTDAPQGVTVVACSGADNLPFNNMGWQAWPNSLPNMRFYYASEGPANPDNPYPANNQEHISLNPVLTWEFGANTTSYDLYFGENQESLLLVVEDGIINDGLGEYSPQNLNSFTQYYWQVVAKNGTNTAQSQIWTFKTKMLISELPYTQNFDSYPQDLPAYELLQWLPQGWSKSDVNWSLRTGFGIDDTACMAVSFSHSEPSILYTPDFEIPSGYRVKFSWSDRDAFRITEHDTLYFEISINDGLTWETLGAYAETSGNTNFWTTETINLNDFAECTAQFRFRHVTDSSVFANGTRLDDFILEPIPTEGEIAIIPQSVIFENIGVGASVSMPVVIKNHSGSLNISNITVADPFSAEFSGIIAEGDSVVVNLFFNPLTADTFISDFTVNITGDFYGENSISISGTAIQPLNVFLQTFESAQAPGLPDQWSKIVKAHNQYSDITVSQSPSDAHNSTKSVKMLDMSDEQNSTLILVSPPTTNFDVNILKIWMKTIWENVRVQIGTMTNPMDESTFEMHTQIHPTSLYTEYTFEFEGISDIRHIAIKKICSDSISSVNIDDISWQTANPVTPPQHSEVVSPLNESTNILVNSNLQWTNAAGSPSGYLISFGTNNPPSNIMENIDLGNVTQYSFVENLDYSTEYFWQIIPYNNSGQTENCPVWSFTTMQDPTITSFPWIENFDAYPGIQIPLGWTVLNLNNDTNTWKTISNPNNPDIAYSQPTALHCAFSFTSPNNDWIFTPPIHFQAGHTYTISFKYHVLTAPEGIVLPEKLQVKWGTQANPDNMFDEPLFYNENVNNLEYLTASAEVTIYDETVYYIGFHSFSDEMQWMIIIDDVMIEQNTSIDNVVAISTGLNQNYPNPFNPETTISFNLDKKQSAKISIYNVKGQLVKELINQELNKGQHSVVWDGKDNYGKNCSTGVYFYRLTTDTTTHQKKMILIK